jgi:2-hydroxychromene-2-carboxylate isomerase
LWDWEFWFDFASSYSYISAMRISKLAGAHGLALRWRPFVLGAIFRAQGWSSSPFILQQAKGVYVWKDMARQCRKVEIPWTMPTDFPRNAIIAHRLALVAADEPWVDAFC